MTNDLKAFLEARGWTEREAAQFFGCSVSLISRIKNRQRRPNGAMAIKMLQVGIDVNHHLDLPRVAS